ncbi:ROK family protein [Streptomyces sp. 184]|uniref:ROK family protein n=1 Tax=Streptomyces sp. 184 TaxID=1827526 RepID=UPI0038927602
MTEQQPPDTGTSTGADSGTATGTGTGTEGGLAVLGRWAVQGGPLALRARIVLLAEQGIRDVDIARRLGVSRQTVGTWRHRWTAHGLDGMRTRSRAGRPAKVDDADVITRTLLSPGSAAASRALARELGLSHATVATIRRSWAAGPPAQPPLPGPDLWLVGLYADAGHLVLLTGARPDAAGGPPPGGTAVGADVLAHLDRACHALPAHDGAARPVRQPEALAGFLDTARSRHPRVALHALVPQGTADLVPRPPDTTVHRIPPGANWRSYLLALVALDSSRHPESSRRVFLDLAGAVEAGTREPHGGPVQWLRESVAGLAPAGAAGTPPGETGGSAPRRETAGGANHIDLGSFNECVVIETVRLAGTVTRGEIAHRTGLTQQSVSRISRSLLTRGILVEDDPRHATSGKPRTPVRLRRDAAHAVGIHIDPEVLTAVVIDLDGDVVASRTRPAGPTADPGVLVKQVIQLGDDVRAAARGAVREDSFLGIGIAVPGPVDIASGTVLDPPLMSVWSDLPLMYLLKDHFRCPLVMEKDAAAASAGERWIGRGRRARDFAYVYLGTGVGSGLYLNGELHRGTSANAGEFGQLCAIALGRTAPDGTPEVLPECNPPVGLSQLADRHGYATAGEPGSADAYRAITAAAAAGDPAASAAVRDLARSIGQGAIALIDLLDIDLVVLGGPFFTDEAAPHYLHHIGELVNGVPTARRLRHVRVEASVLGPEAAAVGAASTIFHAAFTPRLRGNRLWRSAPAPHG